jgi:hypothetical protein
VIRVGLTQIAGLVSEPDRFEELMSRLLPGLVLPILVFLAACATPTAPATIEPLPAATRPPDPTPVITQPLAPTPTAISRVPEFEHIVIVVFENKEYGTVIGNPAMPYFNILAAAYTLLDQHYAVTHPSLPNYIAMISGDTQGITVNCEDCYIDAPSLPDLIEASGRTWKTYQESMPEPCFMGSTVLYVQKHNPFIYFNPIRLDPLRCAASVVPLGQLDTDLAAGALPDFIFITPNLCHDAHDCPLSQADAWLDSLMDKLVPVLEAGGDQYLIALTWDEGQGNHGCCGLPEPAGGRVATVLVSPLAKNGFKDDTQYTHYSLLKTIAEAWHLPYLGRAADEDHALMIAPWK